MTEPTDTLARIRFDVGTVLTSAADLRYLVIDIFGSGKILLCRIPDGLQPSDYHRRFFHDPVPDDPTHVTLTEP